MALSSARLSPLGAVILISAWGCGGSSPTTSTPASASHALTAGGYTLTLSTGPAATGVGISANCQTTTTDAPKSTVVSVDVSGGNGAWTGRAPSGDLALSLTASNTVLVGTIGGTAQSTDGRVTIRVGDNGVPAPVTGQPDPAGGAGGQVSGWVNLTASNGSRGCSINTWNLTPR